MRKREREGETEGKKRRKKVLIESKMLINEYLCIASIWDKQLIKTFNLESSRN